MTDETLARLAAECLSGPTRVGNVRRLSKLLRGKAWPQWERVWSAAGLEGRAPLLCNLNLTGMTAEQDHHPVAVKLRAWANGANG